jgi:hypothetical protein
LQVRGQVLLQVPLGHLEHVLLQHVWRQLHVLLLLRRLHCCTLKAWRRPAGAGAGVATCCMWHLLLWLHAATRDLQRRCVPCRSS